MAWQTLLLLFLFTYLSVSYGCPGNLVWESKNRYWEEVWKTENSIWYFNRDNRVSWMDAMIECRLLNATMPATMGHSMDYYDPAYGAIFNNLLNKSWEKSSPSPWIGVIRTGGKWMNTAGIEVQKNEWIVQPVEMVEGEYKEHIPGVVGKDTAIDSRCGFLFVFHRPEVHAFNSTPLFGLLDGFCSDRRSILCVKWLNRTQ